MNLQQRHLGKGQRAMIATDALPLFEAEAKERQRQAGRSTAPGRPKAQPESTSEREKDPQKVAELSG